MRQVELEELLVMNGCAGQRARHLDERSTAIEADGVVATPAQLQKVSTRAAAEIQDAPPGLATERRQQGVDVLGNVVLARALPEGGGISLIMVECSAGELVELPGREAGHAATVLGRTRLSTPASADRADGTRSRQQQRGSLPGVQPWILVDAARTPDGAALELWRRGEEFSIRTAGQELMGSRSYGSEAQLAELAAAARGAAPGQRVLIGGLGFGFTLAAALRVLGGDARVVVDEISPAVVRWNRGVLGALAGEPLADPRVEVREADVVDHLREGAERFDIVLLDVDNGPSALSQARNAWLYRAEGLARVSAALGPHGVLGVWSASADPKFVERLRRARLRVEEHRVHASGKRGKRHVVWIARH